VPLDLASSIVARAAKGPRKASGSAFLQAGQPAGAGESRASASNGIYGILTQMLEARTSALARARARLPSASGADPNPTEPPASLDP